MMADSSDAIRLIAGLGNPGAEYARTRHNAGFWLVDALAERLGASLKPSRQLGGASAAVEVDGCSFRLFKPDSFVNVSGAPVAAACRYYRIPAQALLVVQDDIDLPDGRVRLKFSGGHGGHKGIRDICAHVGKDFWRLKLGVGHPGRASEVVGYVLRPLSAADRAAVEMAVARTLAQIGSLVAGDFQRAMNALHDSGETPA